MSLKPFRYSPSVFLPDFLQTIVFYLPLIDSDIFLPARSVIPSLFSLCQTDKPHHDRTVLSQLIDSKPPPFPNADLRCLFDTTSLRQPVIHTLPEYGFHQKLFLHKRNQLLFLEHAVDDCFPISQIASRIPIKKYDPVLNINPFHTLSPPMLRR